MSSKSLDEDSNNRLRRIAEAIIRDDFDGVQIRAAEALQIQQGSLSDFLSGKRGAGMKLMQALARRRPEEVASVMRMVTIDASEDRDSEDEIDRYPSRPKCLRAARELGYPPGAIDEVAAMGLTSDEDPGEDFWMDQLRAARDRERFAAPKPAVAAEDPKDEEGTDGRDESGTRPRKMAARKVPLRRKAK